MRKTKCPRRGGKWSKRPRNRQYSNMQEGPESGRQLKGEGPGFWGGWGGVEQRIALGTGSPFTEKKMPLKRGRL